jgi:sulfite exporter TauE/SafE
MHHHAEMADAASWLSSYGIIVSLFVVGLIGSVTHCVGMCSPFVLAQVASRLDSQVGSASGMTELARLRAAALLPYHFGRATSYAALGGAAGLLSSAFMQWTGFRWLAVILLVVGAASFLAMAANRFGLSLPISGRLTNALTRAIRPLSADPRGLKGYLLGIVLGFLPCGLIYGALAVAAASGSAPLGAAAMAAFAVGTMPMLMVAGFAGALMARRWHSAVAFATGPLLALNAVLLLFFAAQLAGV